VWLPADDTERHLAEIERQRIVARERERKYAERFQHWRSSVAKSATTTYLPRSCC